MQVIFLKQRITLFPFSVTSDALSLTGLKKQIHWIFKALPYKSLYYFSKDISHF